MLINILNTLQRWDEWLFLIINDRLANAFFNNVLPLCREANTWLPLYLFLFIFIVINFGKASVPWILFIALTATITDQLSSTLIKDWVARPRPCHNETLMQQANLVINYCSPSYSFTSSHATNHFGAAFFIYTTLKHHLKKWGYLFFIWAALVCYAQVYVGIHYPLDVICGGIVGSFMGYSMASIFNRRVGMLYVK